MFKRNKVGVEYLSAFCLEMSLTMTAGISFAESLLMIAESEDSSAMSGKLSGIYRRLEGGSDLTSAFREADIFPSYMINMINIGERTGHLEAVFKSLSAYYARQASVSRLVKSAVVYPSILFITMLAVIVVLVIMVLPMFNNVFLQLGGSMHPIAKAFMSAGLWLSRAWPVLLGIAALIAVFVLLTRFIPALSVFFKKLRVRLFSGTAIAGQIAHTRFVSALAMTFSSGMDIDSSLEMAAKLCADTRIFGRIAVCRKAISEGKSLSEAISAAKLIEPLYVRMLDIGMKTGATDSVMNEIASRSEERVEYLIEKTIGKVEPALVIIMSAMVGLVLLSVMLPLMGIMSAIG